MNKTEIERCLRNLDRVKLTGLARQVLNDQTVEVVDWHYQAINIGRGSATGGMYRIAGIAQNQSDPLPWSIMLKVLSTSAHGNVPAEAHDIAHPLYWKREALVYQSGLLNHLPRGLLAPRFLATDEQLGDTIWLWLEEVKESAGLWLSTNAQHSVWPVSTVFISCNCLCHRIPGWAGMVLHEVYLNTSPGYRKLLKTRQLGSIRSFAQLFRFR